MACSHAPAAPGHALLAPIPPNVIPKRQPVASREILAQPHGAAIAGWEQLTIELSAGAAGLRHILVVLDAAGQPISASDAVLYRCEAPMRSEGGKASPVEYEFYQESIGGWIEKDGSFRGTRWRTQAIEAGHDSEPRMQSTPSEPSAEDASGIQALVAELIRRAPWTEVKLNRDGLRRSLVGRTQDTFAAALFRWRSSVRIWAREPVLALDQ